MLQILATAASYATTLVGADLILSGSKARVDGPARIWFFDNHYCSDLATTLRCMHMTVRVEFA